MMESNTLATLIHCSAEVDGYDSQSSPLRWSTQSWPIVWSTIRHNHRVARRAHRQFGYTITMNGMHALSALQTADGPRTHQTARSPSPLAATNRTPSHTPTHSPSSPLMNIYPGAFQRQDTPPFHGRRHNPKYTAPVDTTTLSAEIPEFMNGSAVQAD